MKKMTPHILCGGRHTFNNGLKEDKGFVFLHEVIAGPKSHANHSDLAQRQYSNLFPIEKKRVAHTEPAKQPELESELESMELPKEEKSAKQRKAKVLKEKEVVNASGFGLLSE
ncbi:hypothetical protein DEO72_LG5g1993 [Vigna unguiculata]|uniref:Uncharacterized protein n=1 Tax=Vigna unguiculata TaxID=3917 RepID=A0A4D6M144_VIGUN|nr:hypothetical protein DEO72_LG5g1993 [Vigna unguiculata]